MESWQAAQSWALFGVVAVGLAYYYAPKAPRNAPNRAREQVPAADTPKKRKESRPKPAKLQPAAVSVPMPVSVTEAPTPSGNDGVKNRKGKKQGAQPLTSHAEAVQQPEPEEDAIDMSTKQFAEQMAKARQGQKIGGAVPNAQRVRTVKQGSAMTVPNFDSNLVDESSAKNAGDVSDMLESAAAAPSTLRIVASDKPKKEKVAHKPKEVAVETKKQRQNRLKKEAVKEQREEEEKQRKVLAENQRRIARESRGEPAKNGIPIAKPVASNAWSEQPAKPASVSNGTNHGPLLDTFDAESTGSSNGGFGASTAATSTTGASESEQIAQAMRESEDESGWTTVAVPKKQKKTQSTESAGDSTPVAQPESKPKAAPAVKPISGAKPNGFQALDDQYKQRTDLDPSDASNWDP
ncbi:Hypothetical protein R9X50_00253600 [Acrodontium crateriforme]|uniref:Uncharacterized protein n=1 Tax=Acrodontium crateriforme TaxID=150365 RepID=A0AAQ3M1P8_9PEZI|nr:Hypothetical protein R9X50_00253600 [Acrodontium crateriforme]